MKDTKLDLAITRLTFLSSNEKMIVRETIDDYKLFVALSFEDLENIIKRKIKSKMVNCLLELEQMVEYDLKIMERYYINFLTINSKDYPPLLRETDEAPFSLFYRGRLPNPEVPLVSIVGTRRPSGDGVHAASKLGREFALENIPVVSGLARGIDAFAHKSNLEGGVGTIGVLACGVDRLYPRSNCVLAGNIIKDGGCIISEYSPSTEPLAFRFPQRNRIIAGLSRAVVVVEAPKKSGALITADYALNNGRDVFVSKDAIHSVRSDGTRELSKNGALEINSAKEVLSEWGYKSPIKKNKNSSIENTNQSIGASIALEFKNKIFHYKEEI